MMTQFLDRFSLMKINYDNGQSRVKITFCLKVYKLVIDG